MIEALLRRGFTVARKPYLPGQYWARDPERREYTIDIDRGMYRLWGVPPADRPVAELLEEHASRADAVAATQEQHPGLGFFLSECLAAGFAIDADRERGVCHIVRRGSEEIDFGNRFVRFRGTTYLACEWARNLIDADFGSHELSEIVRARSDPNTVQPPRRFMAPSDEPPAETAGYSQRWMFT